LKNKKNVNNNINEELSEYLSKSIELKQTCLEYILQDYYKVGYLYRKEVDLKNTIINILELDPFIIINHILPYIKEKKILTTIKDIQTDDDDYRYKECNIYDTISINQYSVITEVSEPNIECEEHDLNKFLSYNKRYFDYYEKILYLDGKFCDYGNCDIYSIDSLNAKLAIYVKGILKKDNIPPFTEYILEACINIKYNNKKMAYMNLFSSLDNFIELLYKKTFEYFLKRYPYLLYGEDIKSQDILNKNIDDEDIKDFDYWLQNKICYYSNSSRRLIDEKLKSILQDINQDHSNDKKYILQDIVLYFKEAEKIRNKIAHGEKIEEDELEIGELFYNILSLYFYIFYKEDIRKANWSKILCKSCQDECSIEQFNFI